MRIGENVVFLYFSFRIGKIVFFFFWLVLLFVLPMFCGKHFSALAYLFVPPPCVYIYIYIICMGFALSFVNINYSIYILYFSREKYFVICRGNGTSSFVI
jgi:hypothetical protein